MKKTDISYYVRKYDNVRLEDWGVCVSKEFKSFQKSFINAVRKIAKNNNAKVVNPSYGHYDMSCFVQQGDKFVYVSYCNCFDPRGRSCANLTNKLHKSILVRTAKDEHDYIGDFNLRTTLIDLEDTIRKLFEW